MVGPVAVIPFFAFAAGALAVALCFSVLEKPSSVVAILGLSMTIGGLIATAVHMFLDPTMILPAILSPTLLIAGVLLLGLVERLAPRSQQSFLDFDTETPPPSERRR